MTLKGRTVSIVGGGIAGLATARAVALKGAEVTVYERAPAIAEVGAGLQISSNGWRALCALGIEADLAAVAVRSQGTTLIDAMRNSTVLDIAAPNPSYFVYRSRLIEVLSLAATDAGAKIVTGAARSPDDVEGDIVIAADGIRSTFRTLLNQGAEPSYTGQVAWRAVIHDAAAPSRAEVYMGPGRHLVTYPLAGGLRNIVACEDRTDWTAEGWSIEDRPMNLRAAFARFPDHVQDWLSDVDIVFLWGLFQHPVAARWTDDTTALVGDAAHPMLPYLAQGANMALEDAVMLARALEGPGLAAFEAARAPRARRVVAASASNAHRFHLANPVVRQVAFAGLRLREWLKPGVSGQMFDWIWGYDPRTARL